MSSGDPDIIQVVKSNAELRADQRVGRWVQLTGDAVRLEAVDTCCNEVDIVSPPGYNWISIDSSARHSSTCEAFFVALPGISISHSLSGFREAISNERVHAITI